MCDGSNVQHTSPAATLVDDHDPKVSDAGTLHVLVSALAAQLRSEAIKLDPIDGFQIKAKGYGLSRIVERMVAKRGRSGKL